MDPGPFERLLADLVRADVQFLVVGGVAVAMNGVVRATEDVDILLEGSRENIERLLRVLSGWGAGYARDLSPDDFTDEEGCVRLIEEFPVDLFIRMDGRRYADLLAYRRVLAGETPIPYVDAHGLILLKSGSHRPQDKLDVELLARIPRSPMPDA